MNKRELERKKREMERHYGKVLNQLTDEIFEKAEKKGLTWTELALSASLSPGTVARLGNRVTKTPHLRTIVKLGRAVGMSSIRLEVTKRVRRQAA